jgi:hypothetical protein
MGKKSGCRSGMNNPDNFSGSSETMFRVKILKFFDADPGWKRFGSGMKNIRIRDIQTASAKLLPSSSEKSSGQCMDAAQTVNILSESTRMILLELFFNLFLCISGDGSGRGAGADFRGALHCEGSQV